jgi:hypothetical protein
MMEDREGAWREWDMESKKELSNGCDSRAGLFVKL